MQAMARSRLRCASQSVTLTLRTLSFAWEAFYCLDSLLSPVTTSVYYKDSWTPFATYEKSCGLRYMVGILS